jgi:MYXO-CTERM domain-containing protein
MRPYSRCACVLAVAGAALPLITTPKAQAYPPDATVIATRFLLTGPAATGAPVPGLPAATQAAANANGVTVTWNNPFAGQPGLASNPAIDNAGNVVFYGQMAVTSYTDPDTLATTYLVNSSNANTAFYASAASGYAFNQIQIVARDGSSSSPTTGTTTTSPLLGGPTPSTTGGANWTLNSTSGGAGMNAGVSITAGGRVNVSAALNGTGATNNVNNQAVFSGLPGSIAEVVRRGTAAPGLTATNLNTAFNIAVTNNGGSINDNGQMVVQSALVSAGAGSNVVTSGTGQNDSAIFLMGPGGGSLIAQRGDSPAFLNGAVFGAFTSNPGNNGINAAGDVMFTNTLATGAGFGTTPATSTNNQTLMVKPASGPLSLVARSGSAAVVNGNAETFATSGAFNTPGTNNSVGPAFNNSGRLVYAGKFQASANITANTNDQALQSWKNGVTSTLVQTGQTAPGTGGAVFSDLGAGFAKHTLSNADGLAFIASLSGAGITASNNSALFFKDLASNSIPQLIAQTGMTAPGAGGATFASNINGLVINARNTIVFSATLSDTRSGLFAYSPAWGLQPVLFTKDTWLLGANYPIASFNYLLFGNGNGGVLSFNDNDQLALGVTSSTAVGGIGANYANVVLTVPAPAAGGLALAGLAAATRRRRRRR